MKNYLEFEKEIKALEEEVEKLKDPFDKEGISEVKTEEIAKIRDVPMGHDVDSPPGHTAFSNPLALLEFIAQLRELSGGKPVGFKLCVGKRREFIAICKAMHETGIVPDFITVDGGEGGTGAAPMEFSNHIGTPLVEGLIFVHNVLVGYDLRKKVKVISQPRHLETNIMEFQNLIFQRVNKVNQNLMRLHIQKCVQKL